jgi:enediyne biosynthesis protein E4
MMAGGMAAAPPLDWQEGAGFRFAQLPVPTVGRTGFTLLPPEATGITFSNRLDSTRIAINRLHEIGSGVALGDVDGDGLVDIYFCRLEGGNVLYRNLGDWRFEDITSQAGVACEGQMSTGAVLADVNGNGHLDLLVTSLGGGPRLFFNDGSGRFREGMETGLIRRFGATTMALADVDGDGDLDLYIVNYRANTMFDHPPGFQLQSRKQPDGTVAVEPRDRLVSWTRPDGGLQIVEKGEPDILYMNLGQGRFNPVPWTVGVFLDQEGRALPAAPTDWGLTAMFRDLTGNGLPDLYVCNDFVYWPDRVWLNQESRRFQAAPRHAFRSFSLASMAVDAADINRDGFDDLFVADMVSPRRESRARQRPDTLKGAINWPIEDPDFQPEVPRNTLQLARGDGTFAEIAQLAGVAATDWTWSVAFLDVDLDGWEDLLVVTGTSHDVQDADMLAQLARYGFWRTYEDRLEYFSQLPRRLTPSMAFRNQRDLRFADKSAEWGFNAVGVGHGMAFADLDQDGDLDVVVNCLHEPARIYRNNSTAPRLAVRLRGEGANTRGVGARIKITGGPVTQTQEMMAGGRYLSGDDAMRVFATGDATQLDIEVNWRSGKRSVVRGALPNHVYEIWESEAMHPPKPPPAPVPSLFEDVSSRLNHQHVDEPFDDFARQPLLPRRLSTLGPGVAWADLDGDGHVDLLVGGGKSGRPAVFRNDGQGNLTPWPGAETLPINSRDQTAVLTWRGSEGVMRIMLGESNWEDGDLQAPPFGVLEWPPGAAAASGDYSAPDSSGHAATGPLAMADVSGNGHLDLFVGGRAVSGRFPEPATSQLLGNDGRGFSSLRHFPELGLVSGAIFTDLTGDGSPDLVLACEWNALRIFRNENGQLAEWDAPLRWPVSDAIPSQPTRLSELTGWWNGVAAGDFDGDGRLDLVASNWGRNWRIDQPPGTDLAAHLYYGDFNGDHVVQTLLASHDPLLSKITPWREFAAVRAAMPAVSERVADHRAYGRASIETLLGEDARIARRLTATTPDSMILLNRGDHFEPRPLPIEAQFAPAFGISVADFNGDGNEDVFLAQNFFGVDAETSRHDAGIGLILLGDGRGNFRPLSPREAGFSIYGEQRGSAVADFDGDGRVDLVVAQYNGATRLLRNASGRPGVRITLLGSTANPEAIGASVRLQFGEQFGPLRELRAGSGYWSQDAAMQVLAAPTTPTAVEVRWPGGKLQRWTWPENALWVDVSTDGIRLRRSGEPVVREPGFPR